MTTENTKRRDYYGWDISSLPPSERQAFELAATACDRLKARGIPFTLIRYAGGSFGVRLSDVGLQQLANLL